MADGIKRANSSQASHTDAKGGNSRAELVKAMDDLEDERAAVTARKGQVQARLSQIRNLIRGHRLPQDDYARLTAEQSELVAEAHGLDMQQADFNIRLHRLRRDLENNERPDRTQAMVVLLTQILTELKQLNASLASNKQ